MNSSRPLDSVQELMDEILEIQKKELRDIKVLKRVQDIVDQSSKLVEESKETSEITLDAKILRTGSQVINSSFSSFDASVTFREEDYNRGILDWVVKNFTGTAQEKIWECLGPLTYHLYSKSTPVNYIIDSVTLEQLPVKEKVKLERCKKVVTGKTSLTVSPSGSGENRREEVNEDIYSHILKTLVKCYRENDKKPILFLNFVMNPDSYWQSVENIFHFSFLVRDGCVNLFLNEDNLPVVEPVRTKNPNKSQNKGNQFCFSLSKKDWQDCIQKFEITSQMIRPIQKS